MPPIPKFSGATEKVAGLYQVNPEQVRELAAATTAIAEELAEGFASAREDLGSDPLTGFEVGDELVQAHGLAHTIMLETFGGVSADLSYFADALRLAVADAEEADQLSAQQLKGISEIMGGGSNAEARREQAWDNLNFVGPGAGVPGDDGSEGS